jgi:hypothetical protein
MIERADIEQWLATRTRTPVVLRDLPRNKCGMDTVCEMTGLASRTIEYHVRRGHLSVERIPWTPPGKQRRGNMRPQTSWVFERADVRRFVRWHRQQARIRATRQRTGHASKGIRHATGLWYRPWIVNPDPRIVAVGRMRTGQRFARRADGKLARVDDKLARRIDKP